MAGMADGREGACVACGVCLQGEELDSRGEMESVEQGKTVFMEAATRRGKSRMNDGISFSLGNGGWRYRKNNTEAQTLIKVSMTCWR